MSHVQTTQGTVDANGTTIATAPFGANPTQHNCIVGHVSAQYTAGLLTSITDNASGGSNTYQIIDDWAVNSSDGIRMATFVAQDIKAGGSPLVVTANFSAGVNFRRINAREYDTVAAAQPHKHSHSADDATFGTGTDAITTPSVTTTIDGCTIVGIGYDEQTSTIPTVGTGYTSRDSFTGAGGDAWRAEDKVQSAQGSVAVTFTSAGGAGHVGVGLLALEPSGGGAGGGGGDLSMHMKAFRAGYRPRPFGPGNAR